METRPNLHLYASTVTISVGGRRQMTVGLALEHGQEVRMNPYHTLTSLADYYPYRTMRKIDINRAMNSLIRFLQSKEATHPVPHGWASGGTSQTVAVSIDFEEDEGGTHPFPAFTFGDVLQFVTAARAWYNAAGGSRQGELWGAVYYKADVKPIGRLYVFMQGYQSSDPSSPSSVVGNSTSPALSFRV